MFNIDYIITGTNYNTWSLISIYYRPEMKGLYSIVNFAGMEMFFSNGKGPSKQRTLDEQVIN